MINKAVQTAYRLYARPMNHFSGNTELKPSHRMLHGIGHALSVMELIPKVLKIYPGHPFSHRLNSIFGSEETFIELVQILALFHDSARQADGIDKWDQQSSQNAMCFLRKHKPAMDLDLVKLLGLAAEHKDDVTEFKRSIPRRYKQYANDLDLIRKLVKTADQLEIMRCRVFFNSSYVEPVFQDSEAFDQLLRQTIQRGSEEYRMISLPGNCGRSQHDQAIHEKLKEYGIDQNFIKQVQQEDQIKMLSGYDGFSKRTPWIGRYYYLAAFSVLLASIVSCVLLNISWIPLVAYPFCLGLFLKGLYLNNAESAKFKSGSLSSYDLDEAKFAKLSQGGRQLGAGDDSKYAPSPSHKY
ncbi:hypothetical protein N9C31_03250 [Gammaproteobacteria bacterium]|nr:hypothetical protein [Gammaproteobacteria bacterium]